MHRMHLVAWQLTLSALGVLVSLPAFAQAAPDATYALSAQAGSENPLDAPTQIASTPTTVTSSGLNANGSGNSLATISVAQEPSLYATGTISAGPFGFATASAQMYYYVEVYGPKPNVPVPVDITGEIVTTMTAFAGDNGGSGTDLESSGEIELASNSSTVPVQTFAAAGCNSSAGSPCGVFPISATLTVLSSTVGSSANPDTAGSVYLYAAVNGVSEPDGGTAAASVDPILAIDPSFLAANPGYYLVLSDGVGNSPVPLPSTAWLLLSALVGLALVGRRRARRA